MSCHEYEWQIGDYVDGALAPAASARLEAHLAACPRCRVTADDLEALRLMAQTLEPLPPPADVWARVSAASAGTGAPRSFAGWIGRWQSVAAAVVLSLMASGLWWIGGRLADTPRQPAAEVAAVERPAVMLPTSGLLDPARQDAELRYASAIASLEEVAAADRGTLDPVTADVLQAGMTVIDTAIADSRAALTTHPGNEVAQESLFEALRRKVLLLQRMIALINEVRKGNQDGAARIVSELTP
jgi:anti-sigma factor RsiW